MMLVAVSIRGLSGVVSQENSAHQKHATSFVQCNRDDVVMYSRA